MFTCEACDQAPLVYLGTLGALAHFRCRCCGWDQSRPVADLPDDFSEVEPGSEVFDPPDEE